MATQNLLDRYPAYSLAVLRNSVEVPPEDWAAEGITLEVQLDKSIQLTAPDMFGSGGRYDVVVYANAPTSEGALSVTVLEFTDEQPDEVGVGYVNSVGDLVTTALPPFLPLPVPQALETAAGWQGAVVYGGKVPT